MNLHLETERQTPDQILFPILSRRRKKMTKIRRILPSLCLGAVFVVLLIFNLKVFAACPQTQAWQVWCPNAVGPLCSQCKKAFCKNCSGIQQWQDWFQCTNNPNQMTKCVNQLNNQNQPLLQPCYQTCTCMPAQGGGCTINQNNCQPINYANVYTTQGC